MFPVLGTMFHLRLILIFQKHGFRVTYIIKDIIIQKSDHFVFTHQICGVGVNLDTVK